MEFIQVTDVLDIDFKLSKYDVIYKEGTTISEYLSEFESVVAIKGLSSEEIPLDYIVKENDSIIFAVNLGSSGTAKAFLIGLFIVVLAIITWGVATAPAIGGIAGGGGAGGALTGGATAAEISASALATSPGLAGGAGMGAAGAGISSSMLGNLALMAGSMLVNALLAPKAPSGDDRAPERSVYLWNDNKTQSAQMIPIPIVLGKYPLNGNLIGAKTEPKNHKDVNETLHDTGSFIYGLCANQIYDLDELYLNKLKVSDFDDMDISVFYTKGTEDQSYLYGIVDGTDSENETYRFNGLDNDPLDTGEPLIEGLVTETLLNTPLEQPEHLNTDDILGVGYKHYWPEAFESKLVFQGVCDSAGTLLTGDSVNISAGSPSYPPPNFYIKVQSFTLVEMPVPGEDVMGGNITKGYDGTFDTSLPISSGFFIFNVTEMSEDTINTFAPQLTLHFTSYTVINTNEIILTVDYLSTNKNTLEPGYQCTLAKEKEYTIKSSESKLTPFEIDYTTERWLTHTTTLVDVDRFVIELLAPKGLGCMEINKEKIRKMHVWLSFAYDITNTTTGENAQLTAYNHRIFNTATTDVLYPDNTPVLGVIEYDTRPLFYAISSNDILEHAYCTGVLKTSFETAGNKLPAGTYVIKMMILNHGSANYTENVIGGALDGKNFRTYSRVLPDDEQDFVAGNAGSFNWREEQLINDLHVYRIKEYNSKETPDYSYVTNLGLVINATETFNNRLPQISAICKNYVRTCTNFTDYLLETSWTRAYSTNPAYIVLDLLYDSYYGVGIGGKDSDANKWANFLSYVELESFTDFAQYCDEPISLPLLDVPDDTEDFIYEDSEWKPKRYVCHAVLDTTSSAIDWINKILGTFDALVIFKGRKFTLIAEQEIETFIPEQIFTSSNIIKGSFSQTFLNPNILASVLETTFMDEENYYEKVPLTYMPFNTEFVDTKKKTTVNVFGMTNRQRVLKRLNTLAHRTNTLKQQVSWSTSTAGFTLTLGAQVGVTHEYIEWGAIGAISEDVKASGRVNTVSCNDTTEVCTVYLDKTITQDNQDVDLIGKYCYFQHLGDDTNFYVTITAYNTALDAYSYPVGVTYITFDYPVDVNALATMHALAAEDLFLLGVSSKEYKEVIVNGINIQPNNIVSLKGMVYDETLYETDIDFITDIAGNTFSADDCEPNHTIAFWVEGLTNIYLSWTKPNILDPNKNYTFDVSLVKYLIYSQLKAISGTAATTTKWKLIGETTKESFEHEIEEFNTDYFYKVVPVLNLAGSVVQIPKSWCTAFSIRVDYSVDYLPKLVVTNTEFTNTDFSSDYVDMNVYIEKVQNLSTVLNEMVLVWRKYNSSSSNSDWYGPQSITLLNDADRFASFIDVTSITDLPKKVGYSTHVYGLVIINDEEIVFVDGTASISGGYRLSLVQSGEDYVGRRYSLGTDQASGVSVKNAHLGFQPTKYFATVELNGIASEGFDPIITMDSIFAYDFDSNTVSSVTTSSGLIVKDLETIALTPDYWRLTSGYNDLITTPARGGETDTNKFYIYTKAKGIKVIDLGLSCAFKDITGYAHDISAVLLSDPIDPNLGQLAIVEPFKGNQSYFTIKNIPKSGTTWISLTRAQTSEGNFGYTSYPVTV